MTIKTREPDERFRAQVPDFKLEKRTKPRYRTWRDDPDLEGDKESISTDVSVEALKQHPDDTESTPKQHPDDTESTPKQHPDDTKSLRVERKKAVKRHTDNTADDTESTPKQHTDDTKSLRVERKKAVKRHTDNTADDTESTPKQHTDDTSSLWAVTGLKRSVLFGLCDMALLRRETKILGVKYDEVAVQAGVKPASVRTTMKRLRDEGWIIIESRKGNYRTINVDVGRAYQQYVTKAHGVLMNPRPKQHPDDTPNDTQTTHASSVVVFTTENSASEESQNITPQPTTTNLAAATEMDELIMQRKKVDECLRLISFTPEARKYIGDSNVRELLRLGHSPIWVQKALDIFSAIVSEPDNGGLRNPPAVFMAKSRMGEFLNPPRGYLQAEALKRIAKQNEDSIESLIEEEVRRKQQQILSENTEPTGSLDDIPF